MTRWAPDKTPGEHPYVQSRTEWGRSSHRIVYASSLPEAKRQHGWTRERFVRITLRRATPEDVERYPS